MRASLLSQATKHVSAILRMSGACSSNSDKIVLALKQKMPEYLDVFVDNGWDDMLSLQHLTDEALVEMGIKKKGHRVKILHSLRGNSSHSETSEGLTINTKGNNSHNQADYYFHK